MEEKDRKRGGELREKCVCYKYYIVGLGSGHRANYVCYEILYCGMGEWALMKNVSAMKYYIIG